MIKRIAVLDDDPYVIETTSLAFEEAGYNCHSYSLSRAMLQALERETFDLLLIDWNMPDMSGIDVVRRVRQRDARTPPILLITSRNTESDVVEALHAGADDYVVKPLRPAELLARSRALMRRSSNLIEQEDVLVVEPFRFELNTGVVQKDGQPIELTQKEFVLAVLIFRNLGRPLSRGHLMEIAWGRDNEVMSRSLDTHMSRLRTRLELKPEHGFLLMPIRGFGYRLERIGEAAE